MSENKYYQTKKELEKGVNENIEKSINSAAKMLAYKTINKMNIEEEFFGNITLKKDYEYEVSQEVAAWRTAYDIKAGEYKARFNIREGKINVYFDSIGVLKDNYTPSLFGGVAYGESKIDPNIGKEKEIMQGVYSPDKFDINIESEKVLMEIKQDKYSGSYYSYSLNFENQEVKNIIEKEKLKMLTSSSSYIEDNLVYSMKNNVDHRMFHKEEFKGTEFEDIHPTKIYNKIINQPENKEKFRKEYERLVELNIKDIKASKENNFIELYIEEIKDWKEDKLELREGFKFENFQRKIQDKINELIDEPSRDERVLNTTYKEKRYLSFNMAHNAYLENKKDLESVNFDSLLNKAVGKLNNISRECKSKNKISL
jgi:hypothetical protein